MEEVSAAMQGRALCGSVQGAPSTHVSPLEHNIQTVPCPGSTEQSQGCSRALHHKHHLLLCQGEAGDSQPGALQVWGGWERGAREEKVPQPLTATGRLRRRSLIASLMS